ncbi:MAG: hypothetical protein ACRDZY_20920, partial [Acidimicrobiales bacterium]
GWLRAGLLVVPRAELLGVGAGWVAGLLQAGRRGCRAVAGGAPGLLRAGSREVIAGWAAGIAGGVAGCVGLAIWA